MVTLKHVMSMNISKVIIDIVNGIINKEPKYFAGFICTVIFIVLFTFISYHLFTIDREYDNTKNNDHDHDHDHDHNHDHDKVNDFWNELKQQEEMYNEGTTDRYEWKQNDREIDLYIPIDDSVTSKNIKIDFKSNSINITIDTIKFNLNEETFLDIIPYECAWQIENNYHHFSKCLWITLSKKIPTKQASYWYGAFKADVDYSKINSKPSLYSIDKDDPNSLKEAVRNLKTKLKQDNKKNN